MAKRKTVAELETELDSANEYIDSLESKLDNIAGIATDEDEDSEEDEEDDDSGNNPPERMRRAAPEGNGGYYRPCQTVPRDRVSAAGREDL